MCVVCVVLYAVWCVVQVVCVLYIEVQLVRSVLCCECMVYVCGV